MEEKTIEDVMEQAKQDLIINETPPPEPKKIYTPWELFHAEGLDDNSGWAGLVRPFLHKVNNYNKDREENEKILITQIKEKWGSLCLYNYGADLVANVSLLEKASNHICEHCGSPFNVGKYQVGWIETVCKECAIKENKYEDCYEYMFILKDKTIKTDWKTFSIILTLDEHKKYEKTNSMDIFCTGLPWERLNDRFGKHIRKLYCGDDNICTSCTSCLISKYVYLKSVEKFSQWNEYYSSVHLDGIIRFALKIQKAYNSIKKIYEKISWKIYWNITRKIKIKYNNFKKKKKMKITPSEFIDIWLPNKGTNGDYVTYKNLNECKVPQYEYLLNEIEGVLLLLALIEYSRCIVFESLNANDEKFEEKIKIMLKYKMLPV